MSQKISLKEAERKVFTSTYNDGMWDIFLGAFFLMFAIAPLLSNRLGDFWSSVIFLPFWGLVYLVILLVRRYVVRPRTGIVIFGQRRIARLMKFNLVMLGINTVAMVLGLAVALSFTNLPSQAPTMILGLIFLIGFSLAAYFLDFSRFYLYGLLTGTAPLVGEWLYRNLGATHHGFPVTFGFVAGLMVLSGLVIFVRFLRDNPVLHSEGVLDERNAA
ncbi:MAG TPA: hypothetical protein VLA49_09595 [Anaerolineales bacterium]|nr:hypothetical protein [Anaerolineales bacterium]